jgi:uncharacterized protein (TIGR02145 family)
MTAILSGCSGTQEGKSIKTVIIKDQEWMAENLDLGHFRNGDPIPEAKTDEQWVKAGVEGRPAWCYYDNDPKNGKKFGRLYNWYAVTDPRGLAPEGWHIPSREEWTQLDENFGGIRAAGEKLKSTGGWACEGNGTNESGFNGLPGGIRTDKGNFEYLGQYGYWWSSTEFRPKYAYYRYLYCHSKKLFTYVNYYKDSGFSVRCIRD